VLILGIESSAKAASVALWRDGELLAESFQRTALTHSRTLLPMAEDLLRNAELTIHDVDCVAVAEGPGSFTGVRIGVATAKGLCWGAEKKAVGVSTLEAMSHLALAAEGEVVCCVMDARRAQVYGALYEIKDGRPCRLTEDRAMAAAELAAEVKAMDRRAYVLGDGWAVFERELRAQNVPCRIAPEGQRWQRAWGVCQAAASMETVSAGDLLPVYLRLSQAERERLEREKKNN